MKRYNPLFDTGETHKDETASSETASPLFPRASNHEIVEAFTGECGSSRQVRVRANLTTKEVVPLMK